MKLVYSNGGKFSKSTLTLKKYEESYTVKDEETGEEYKVETELSKALANGYKWVSDEDYEALCRHEKCWDNGVLIPYAKTEEEIATEKRKENFVRITEIKSLLKATDYQAIKYAEGLLNDIEYEPIRVQRQDWRDEINRLEDELRY